MTSAGKFLVRKLTFYLGGINALLGGTGKGVSFSPSSGDFGSKTMTYGKGKGGSSRHKRSHSLGGTRFGDSGSSNDDESESGRVGSKSRGGYSDNSDDDGSENGRHTDKNSEDDDSKNSDNKDSNSDKSKSSL